MKPGIMKICQPKIENSNGSKSSCAPSENMKYSWKFYDIFETPCFIYLVIYEKMRDEIKKNTVTSLTKGQKNFPTIILLS